MGSSSGQQQGARQQRAGEARGPRHQSGLAAHCPSVTSHSHTGPATAQGSLGAGLLGGLQCGEGKRGSAGQQEAGSLFW